MCAGHAWANVEGVSDEVVSIVDYDKLGSRDSMLMQPRYHWSVEYFEDLRNVNHCEFIIMKRSENNGRYILQNELRTWSELKRRAAREGITGASSTTPSRPTPLSNAGQVGLKSSPTIPTRRWGGCVNGCNHDKVNYPRRPMRKNTMDYLGGQLPPPATSSSGPLDGEKEDHPVAAQDADHAPVINEPTPGKLSRKQSTKTVADLALPPTPASPNDASNDASSSEDEEAAPSLRSSHQHTVPRTAAIARHLQPPQKTPGEGFSDDSDYFPGMQHLHHSSNGHRKLLRASSRQRQESKERKLARRQTEQSWKEESGMGTGARTDRLGDGDATSDDAGLAKGADAAGEEKSILREALKGDMIVERSEEDREQSDEDLDAEKKIGVADVQRLKDAERKGFGEVY